MEIGNMMFGNSMGKFKIERGKYETQMQFLFLAMGVDSYGEEFKNDIFEVHPYYWGDCTCGYDELEQKWSEENKHEYSCYQKLVDKDLIKMGFIMTSWGVLNAPKNINYDRAIKIKDGIRAKWCNHFGLTYPQGCAVHCTCSHDKKWREFYQNNTHKSNCPIVIPNFKHYKSGLEIKWYKYPLRDAYSNMEIDQKMFLSIIKDCIVSLKEWGNI